MKKALLFSFLFSISSSLLVSCHCKKKVSSEIKASTETKESQPAARTDFEKEGYSKATVVNYTVDGCNFLLQLADEKKLEPTNLPTDFKKDKLTVWVKYAAKKGGMSTCMTGQIVEISDIQLR